MIDPEDSRLLKAVPGEAGCQPNRRSSQREGPRDGWQRTAVFPGLQWLKRTHRQGIRAGREEKRIAPKDCETRDNTPFGNKAEPTITTDRRVQNAR